MRNISKPAILSAILLTFAGVFLWAQDQYNPDLDYAQVVYVKAVLRAESWTFSVTVRHRDEGWDHYADRWQVLNPASGAVIGERTLLHPHETEQPFTRSQSGIEIPADVSAVLVRAGCTKHGFGGAEVLVDLSNPGKTGLYEVVK